ERCPTPRVTRTLRPRCPAAASTDVRRSPVTPRCGQPSVPTTPYPRTRPPSPRRPDEYDQPDDARSGRVAATVRCLRHGGGRPARSPAPDVRRALRRTRPGPPTDPVQGGRHRDPQPACL